MLAIKTKAVINIIIFLENSSATFNGYNSVDAFIALGMEYVSPVGPGISFRFMPGLTNVFKDAQGGETVHNSIFGINLVYQFEP